MWKAGEMRSWRADGWSDRSEILAAPIAAAGESFRGVDGTRIAVSSNSPMKSSKTRGRRNASGRPPEDRNSIVNTRNYCLSVRPAISSGAERKRCALWHCFASSRLTSSLRSVHVVAGSRGSSRAPFVAVRCSRADLDVLRLNYLSQALAQLPLVDWHP